jgi:hypothetical protein
MSKACEASTTIVDRLFGWASYLAEAAMSSMKSSSADDAASDTDSEEGFPPEIEKNIPGECTFCRKILHIVEKEVSEVRGHVNLDIGPIDEMLSSECSRHKPLLDVFSEDLKLEEKKGFLSISRNYFSSSFHFSTRSEAAKYSDTIGYTTDLDLLEGSGLGIRLDSSWVDEKAASKWYEDCITSHGKKCSSPQYLQLLPAPTPGYFIDTSDNCLIPAPADAPYAALSYVWGQIRMTNTTNLNLFRLQQPGAFEDPEIQKYLPRTIRHAMYLTRKLQGLRYLWVDALCIVQDDEEMLNLHLPQMGSIYANASIVITSIDGTNADYGLHGMEDAPDSVPRQIKQSTIPFGDKYFVKRHKTGERRDGPNTANVYFDRGWTFQEHFFSRRSICFENDSIWFRCCTSTRYEDHRKSESLHGERDWILAVGYPSVTVFSRVIGDFNKRQLSFPQDCLLAFAGALPCYTKIFTGGFVCGLPEMFIDAMLLWQPDGNLVRRVPVHNANKPPEDSKNTILPSWSWVGWQGTLNFDGWYTANDFVAGCSGWIATSRCQTISTTTWYVCTSPHGTERRKINCLWTEWRQRYKDPDIKLPKGWTKRLKKVDEGFTCEDSPPAYGKYVYQFKKSENPTFWYPLPLSDPTGVPKTDASSAYLCGEVQTAHAYTFGDVSTVKYCRIGELEAEYAYISLSNADGKWIGMMRLHSADYFEKKGIDLGKGRFELQLIAISEGSVPNGLQWGYHYVDEYEMEERPREGSRYEFVNVLWVSYEGGVARREALGRVAKVYWEELGAKMLDVVLE